MYLYFAFQFTQPKRAATLSVGTINPVLLCFNSRSPSGLRQGRYRRLSACREVSIHAAQAGCDLVYRGFALHAGCFNSRSPSGLRQIARYQIFELRGFNSRSPSGLRLANDPLNTKKNIVSIHAAQAGCDKMPLSISGFK